MNVDFKYSLAIYYLPFIKYPSIYTPTLKVNIISMIVIIVRVII